MHLIKFLLIGSISAILFGELGKFPFGSSSGVISILDITVTMTVLTFILWRIVNNQRIYIPKKFKWLMYFWLMAFISLALSSFKLNPNEVLIGGLYLIRLVIFSSLTIVVFNLIKDKFLTKENIFNLLTNVSLLLSVIGIMQLIVYPNFEDPPLFLTNFGFDPHRGRLTSVFLDPNFMGVFLSISLGLVINKLLQFVNLKLVCQFLLIFSGLLLTLSRSAYLFVITSTIFLLIFGWQNLIRRINRNKLFGVGLIIMCTILLMIFVPKFSGRIIGAIIIDQSASQRFESWQNGISLFANYPIFGVGFNNTRVYQVDLNLIKPYSPEGGHSGGGIDSSLLLVLATTGVVGICFYLIYWYSVIIGLIKKRSLLSASLVSIFLSLIISSQFINSLFYPPIMVFYFCLLGCIDD